MDVAARRAEVRGIPEGCKSKNNYNTHNLNKTLSKAQPNSSYAKIPRFL